MSAFNAGIGLKVSANIDLAALDLQGLASGGSFDDFIKNSDLSKIELAIEFIEVNPDGYFANTTRQEARKTATTRCLAVCI